MARYTQAYSSFVSALDEVQTLCYLASRKEVVDAIKHGREVAALVRGSVVLLSGHIEGYVKELGEIAISSLYEKAVPRADLPDQFFYFVSRSLLSSINESKEPETIGRNVFRFIGSDHAEHWSRHGSFNREIDAEQFNQGFANPKVDQICRYFRRFGYGDFRRDLMKTLQGSYQITVNSIDHLVDTRNAIAHGDKDEVKTASEAMAFVRIARQFCATTDSLFAAWWRDRFCAIR